MKTALFIHSYQAANEMVKRHWPFYKRSGFDLFGVGRTDKKCEWPEPIPTKDIGVDSYINGENLCRRLIDTYDWYLHDPIFKDYTHACIVECDTIFIRKPPELDIRVNAHMAGGPQPGFQAKTFHHCPWWLNRDYAKLFVMSGKQLVYDGQVERGSPDYFFDLVFELMDYKIQHLDGTFSRNSFDLPQDRKLVQERIRKGEVWFVHGVKTKEQLEEILS